MNITDRAKGLIFINSKTWLADKLGISRVTLDKRIAKSDWKKTEIQSILLLSK